MEETAHTSQLVSRIMLNVWTKSNITQYDAYLPYGELLVDKRYQYNPQAKPGSEGGTLNPAKRKVTQKDIDHLKINKLKFRNGKAYIGHVSD